MNYSVLWMYWKQKSHLIKKNLTTLTLILIVFNIAFMTYYENNLVGMTYRTNSNDQTNPEFKIQMSNGRIDQLNALSAKLSSEASILDSRLEGYINQYVYYSFSVNIKLGNDSINVGDLIFSDFLGQGIFKKSNDTYLINLETDTFYNHSLVRINPAIDVNTQNTDIALETSNFTNLIPFHDKLRSMTGGNFIIIRDLSTLDDFLNLISINIEYWNQVIYVTNVLDFDSLSFDEVQFSYQGHKAWLEYLNNADSAISKYSNVVIVENNYVDVGGSSLYHLIFANIFRIVISLILILSLASLFIHFLKMRQQDQIRLNSLFIKIGLDKKSLIFALFGEALSTFSVSYIISTFMSVLLLYFANNKLLTYTNFHRFEYSGTVLYLSFVVLIFIFFVGIELYSIVTINRQDNYNGFKVVKNRKSSRYLGPIFIILVIFSLIYFTYQEILYGDGNLELTLFISLLIILMSVWIVFFNYIDVIIRKSGLGALIESISAKGNNSQRVNIHLFSKIHTPSFYRILRSFTILFFLVTIIIGFNSAIVNDYRQTEIFKNGGDLQFDLSNITQNDISKIANQPSVDQLVYFHMLNTQDYETDNSIIVQQNTIFGIPDVKALTNYMESDNFNLESSFVNILDSINSSTVVLGNFWQDYGYKLDQDYKLWYGNSSSYLSANLTVSGFINSFPGFDSIDLTPIRKYLGTGSLSDIVLVKSNVVDKINAEMLLPQNFRFYITTKPGSAEQLQSYIESHFSTEVKNIDTTVASTLNYIQRPIFYLLWGYFIILGIIVYQLQLENRQDLIIPSLLIKSSATDTKIVTYLLKSWIIQGSLTIIVVLIGITQLMIFMDTSLFSINLKQILNLIILISLNIFTILFTIGFHCFNLKKMYQTQFSSIEESGLTLQMEAEV